VSEKQSSRTWCWQLQGDIKFKIMIIFLFPVDLFFNKVQNCRSGLVISMLIFMRCDIICDFFFFLMLIKKLSQLMCDQGKN